MEIATAGQEKTSGCVASIARLVYGVKLLHATDQIYAVVQNALWSFTEQTIIVVASSLPLLPRFFQLVFKKTKAPSYDGPRTDEFLRQQRDGADCSGMVSSLNKAYIPLEGVDASHYNSTKITGGKTNPSDWDFDEIADIERATFSNAIMKTVRLESDSGKR
ncbi:MAG: hypothetical protein Q9167_002992 [Letrouitia subvulpina]